MNILHFLEVDLQNLMFVRIPIESISGTSVWISSSYVHTTKRHPECLLQSILKVSRGELCVQICVRSLRSGRATDTVTEAGSGVPGSTKITTARRSFHPRAVGSTDGIRKSSVTSCRRSGDISMAKSAGRGTRSTARFAVVEPGLLTP